MHYFPKWPNPNLAITVNVCHAELRIGGAKKEDMLVPGVVMEAMVSMVTTFSNGDKLVGKRTGWLKSFS